jgi:aspartyl-tRNA(Asn)/glutamyl-tRNA(Gln) amidotransferase subunit A
MEVVGPIARNVGDLLRMLAVIAPRAQPVGRGMASARRIACWTEIAGSPVDEEILAGLERACAILRRRGHIVSVREAPAIVDRFNREAWPVLGACGLAGVLAPLARERGEDAVAAQLTPAMRAMWQAGLALPAGSAGAAQELVRELRASLEAMFQTCDVLMSPAAAALPWPAAQTHPTRIAGREVGPRGHAVFTAFANACGLPALALPLGHARSGLPFGMQFVGARGADEALCQLGLEWEAAQAQPAGWPAI